MDTCCRWNLEDTLKNNNNNNNNKKKQQASSINIVFAKIVSLYLNLG